MKIHRFDVLAVGVILSTALAGCQRHHAFITDVAVRSNDVTARPDPAPDMVPAASGPYEARQWRRLAWMDERGVIPEDGFRKALEQRRATLVANAGRRAGAGAAGSTSADWIDRGPANVGGRTRSLIIHPQQPDRMWAGAVSGGIWSSTDGGLVWTPADDWMESLAVGCLAFDPNDPDVIYAGTGEGYYNADAIGGAGIYRSTNAGLTWQQLAATADWVHVNRIVVSPDDSNVILAATRASPGLQRSDDGGMTWATPFQSRGSLDVDCDPTDASKMIAQCIDYDWDQQHWYQFLVYSTDGGASWNEATGDVSHMQGYLSRIEIAYAPSQPSTVYASCSLNGGQIYRSLDGGQSYTLQTVVGTTGADWYTNPLWVDPTNPDMLLTGDVHVLKSMDGGVTFTQISSGYIMTDQPHVDIHFFMEDPGFDAASNRRVYVCTDGGVWVADDIDAASVSGGWERLDQSYRTVQFYGAAGDAASGILVGGTQDNGTLCNTMSSTDAVLTFGGDGGFCAIDADDPNYVYGEHTKLRVHRSTDGGLTANYIHSGIADAGGDANFAAPLVLDPNDGNRLLAGGRSLWRSTDCKAAVPTWTSIRGPGSDRVSAICVARGDSNTIWIAQNGGQVYRTDSGLAVTPSWTTIDDNSAVDPLPDRYVTRLLIDPSNHQVVYVAFGGFDPDNLWRTVDNGQTWTDVTGAGVTGLPDTPIRGIARHPQLADWLYVGTEVGVFFSADGGTTWSTNDAGPSSACVDEIVFMHGSNVLLAATHGRGLFTNDLGQVGDVDRDGAVDVTDLLLVLGAWGTCPAPCSPGAVGEPDTCSADANRDCSVDVADLLLVLADWD